MILGNCRAQRCAGKIQKSFGQDRIRNQRRAIGAARDRVILTDWRSAARL
jgi:hypothetical protein